MAGFEKGNIASLDARRRYNKERIGKEYTRTHARSVVTALGELGLDTQYMAMLARHIEDLNVVVNPEHSHIKSRLTVVKDEEQDKFKRFAIINESDIDDRAKALRKTGMVLGYGITPDVANRLAFDMMFFELSADALANVYYLQRNIGKYVPDFNGQSYAYESQYAISEDFMAAYAMSSTSRDDIAADHHSFRYGIALHMLPNSLLQQDVFDSQARAQHFSHTLAAYYPGRGVNPRQTTPLNDADLTQRFVFMEPYNIRAELASLILAHYGPDDA